MRIINLPGKNGTRRVARGRTRPGGRLGEGVEELQMVNTSCARILVLAGIGLSARAAFCLNWSTPTALMHNSGNSIEPRGAIDVNGDFHVVWYDNVSGQNEVYYATNAGGSWSAPYMLSSASDGRPSTDPDITTWGTDVHMAFFGNPSGSDAQVTYRKKSGASWSAPIIVSEGLSNARYPAISYMDGVGPMIAFHRDEGNGDSNIYFTQWTGSDFGTPILISPGTGSGDKYGSQYPNLAISPNGDLTVAWPDSTTGTWLEHANRRVGGVWQGVTRLTTNGSGLYRPGIGAAPDNSVHLVYYCSGGGCLWYQKWNGSSWSTPVNLPGGLPAVTRPSLAVDSCGGVHVAAENDQDDIYYTNNAGGTWSPWLNLSHSSGNSKATHITYGAGKLLVVWHDFTNGGGAADIWYTWAPDPCAGAIAGRVGDASGQPIAGATLSDGAGQTTSGPDGTYRLDGVPPGTYQVTASKTGFVSQTISGVVVQIGQTATCDFVLLPVIPGDFDQDQDVDQQDFGRFQACFTGQGVLQDDPACAPARLDQDVDVDQDDFDLFQKCLTGANTPGNPDCAK
jgi:hypothetical protein